MEEFKNWLETEKQLSQRSARDVCSRLRRSKDIAGISKVSSKSVSNLEDIDEFNDLSSSVKSQLKRSIKLYLEFSKKL